MAITICFSLVGLGVILIVYVKMLQRENTNLVLQENLIREHYKTLEYQIEQTRRIRHEIANHIYLLEQLAMKSGEKEQLERDYKNELEKTYQILQSKTVCKDIMIDTAIKNKLRECQEKQIQIEYREELFSVGNITTIDMMGLVYNIFDNAIEACEKLDAEKRWIRMSIKNEKDTLILTCHNSKNPDIYLVAGQKTTKKDKENHGIGRDIMKSIVRRYHGSISFEDRREEYHLKIVCRCICDEMRREN